MAEKRLMKIMFSGELTEAEKSLADQTFTKLAKDGQIRLVNLHVKKHNASGGGDTRVKSCVVLRAKTSFGFLVSEGIAWQFNLALSEAIRRLEEQLHRRIGKSKERTKRTDRGKVKEEY